MPDAFRLIILIELRNGAGLSQADAARLCGLTGSQARKSMSDWEQGKAVPEERRRHRFIGYLWDDLHLRKRPEEFERVWNILVEEWEWQPISDGEWSSFTGTPRPPHNKTKGPAKPIPLQKPLRAQHFIGRQGELDRLLDDLQPGRIVTLCGPGGMGKSALAAEAIWTLAPGDEPPKRFPDGVFSHSFNGQPQTALALEAIARAYGVDPRPSPRDAARQALAGKTALILLESAEEADDRSALLAVTGGCGVLVTMRRHLRGADKSQDIGKLPPAESLALLRAWAGSYASDDAAAQELVRLLDGLPFALVLVGHYLTESTQKAEDYATWLKEQGLTALHFDDRPEDSVPLLLRRSLEQVSETARAAFSAAGVLALAPFAAEAVAAALEITVPAAHHALGELVDYGLLLRPDDRYQVTHALAYSYARTQAAPDGETAGRLAFYYAGLAKTESGRGPAGFAVLDGERAHIVAVQAAALAVGQWDAVREIAKEINGYLDLKGYWIDLFSVTQAGLFAARAASNRYDEMALANALGLTCVALGKTRYAIKLYEQTLIIARKIGDQSNEAYTLGNLGLAYANLGEHHQAIHLYKQVLTIARKIGDRYAEGAALGNLGNVYENLGDIRQAIKYHKQAIVSSRKIGERRSEGITLGNLGNSYLILGNVHRAIDLYEQQLVIAQEISNRREEGNAFGNLGNSYLILGDLRHAVSLYEQQLAIVREIDDRYGEGNALGGLGNAYYSLGETRRAVELYEQQLVITREIGDRRGEAIGSWNLGLAHEKQGDLLRAVANMQVRLGYEQKISHPDAAAHAQYVAALRQRAGLNPAAQE